MKMGVQKIISDMKSLNLTEAENLAIPILNVDGKNIGKLIPVGNWVLSESDLIESIRTWRHKTMKMFMTQFESTYEKTYNYLKDIAISHGNRIFFIISDDDGRMIGHIGLANIDAGRGELDNLMRGVDGGDPRLIYYAELALLNWGFEALGISKNVVHVISYNWLVLALHEEVGYTLVEKEALKKIEDAGLVYHEVVELNDANVKYSNIKLSITNTNFYQKNNWVKPNYKN